MHAIRGNRPTHINTHTHRQKKTDRTDYNNYTAPQLAHSVNITHKTNGNVIRYTIAYINSVASEYHRTTRIKASDIAYEA